MKFKLISQILQCGRSYQRYTVWSSTHFTRPLIKLYPGPLNPCILSRTIFPGTPVQFVTAASLCNNQNKEKAHCWFSCIALPCVLRDTKLSGNALQFHKDQLLRKVGLEDSIPTWIGFLMAGSLSEAHSMVEYYMIQPFRIFVNQAGVIITMN